LPILLLFANNCDWRYAESAIRAKQSSDDELTFYGKVMVVTAVSGGLEIFVKLCKFLVYGKIEIESTT
jgi:hypothetical protein